ncbi:MAG: hypothetical protein WBC22_15920 [Sedimentisphaerales bacterium]
MSETRNSSLLEKITVVIVICCCGLSAKGKYGGGSGTAEYPYLIYNADQMNAIGANQGDWNKHFKLMADIDLSSFVGSDFNMIGYYHSYYNKKAFSGVFDGNGHTISNFTYNSNSEDKFGIFVYIHGSGQVRNVVLLEPNVVYTGTSSYCLTSPLVSYMRGGSVENCGVKGGSVSGRRRVGAVVGYVYAGQVTRCWARSVEIRGSYSVGGLLGGTNWDATVSECYANCDVQGGQWVGGCIGENDGWVQDSYAQGRVVGSWNVGGFMGAIEEGETTRNCYSTAKVEYAIDGGGFSGSWGWGIVEGCFWDIETSGQTTSGDGTGLPTARMQDANTFIDAGWDFNTPIWTIDEGHDYPRLWWEKYIVPMVSSLKPTASSVITKSDINIDVTFTKEVFGVDSNDMILSNTASVNAAVAEPSYLGARTWRFPITGLADGALDVSLSPEPNNIEDANGNDLWPIPIRWSYNVLLLTPVLHAEPEVTLGSSNVISWDDVPNADKYFAQCANEPNFTNITATSGWIVDNNCTFWDLNLWQQYWYRVKGRAPRIQRWVQTSKDEFENDALENVSAETVPGDVVLVRGQKTQSTSNYVGDMDQRMDSVYAACTVNYFKFKYDCELTNIRHYIDPGSGANEVVFSVYEAGSKTGTYHRIHKNNAPVTTSTAWNWYSSGTISVPIKKNKYYAMGIGCSAGFHYLYNTRNTTWISWGQKIGARDYYSSSPSWLPAITGPFTSNTTYYQRFSLKRIVDAGYHSGNIVSTTIELPVGGDWADLSFTATLPTDTNVSVDVLDGFNDSIIIEDVNSGCDLSEIAATAIKLRANLSTDNSNVTPALHDWSVTYTDPCVIIESDFSNVESSMQGTLLDAVDIMLDPNSLKNENMKNALLNKIDEVLEMIYGGLYEDALSKLEHDILQKTNGCGDAGEPDKNDWIITCEEQSQVYPLVVESIESVKTLMEESPD